MSYSVKRGLVIYSYCKEKGRIYLRKSERSTVSVKQRNFGVFFI